jgi:hypothetical protein
VNSVTQTTDKTGAAGDAAAPRFRPALSRPAILALVLVAIFAALVAAFGVAPASQATVNGLVAGGYIGLGAIGVTLVLGVLGLVNFAHGDLLLTGAYLTILFACSACRCRSRWPRRSSAPASSRSSPSASSGSRCGNAAPGRCSCSCRRSASAS